MAKPDNPEGTQLKFPESMYEFDEHGDERHPRWDPVERKIQPYDAVEQPPESLQSRE